jgi:hypothetical protein
MVMGDRELMLELIKRSLREWSAEMPRARELLEGNRLSYLDECDVELVSDILLKELIATGLDDECEPTKRGMDLEAAIDWIRSSPRKPIR